TPASKKARAQKQRSEHDGQQPSPRSYQIVPQKPYSEDGGHNGQPGARGQDGLEQSDSPRVNDPVVFFCQQPAMQPFEGIAFFTRDNVLVLPGSCLGRLLSDSLVEQVVVKLRPQPHRLADEKAAEFQC